MQTGIITQQPQNHKETKEKENQYKNNNPVSL